MYEEYEIENGFQHQYQSRYYEDGREEQIRLPELDGVLFDTTVDSSSSLNRNITRQRKKNKHVQAFVNNISAPKSLEEMIFLVENTGRFTVEELLYDGDTTEWTAPRWTKYGDIVFFMHSKTANSSLTAIRTELNRTKNRYSDAEYKEYMEWIDRGLRLHKQYGGKIFAVAKVSGPLFEERPSPDELFHWRSRLYAEMNGVTILENPIDISEFRDFLMISRVSGITSVFGSMYTNLKELITRKNKLPYYMKHTDATPLPLANINTENWMTLSNEYRRAFMLESQFRHYYVDYLLHEISDRKTIFSECRCQKTGMADSFVDNVIYIKGNYLSVEVKLSVPAQANIKAQVRKYCYDDNVILDKKGRNAGPDKFHKGKCLVIDTDNVFMFDYDKDEISQISDLDSVSSLKKVSRLKDRIESLLLA